MSELQDSGRQDKDSLLRGNIEVTVETAETSLKAIFISGAHDVKVGVIANLDLGEGYIYIKEASELAISGSKV